MKITPEDYAVLESAIKRTIARTGLSLDNYTSLGLTAKRYRWDLLEKSQMKSGDGSKIDGDVNIYAYANNINTTEGGTHLSGFRSALTRAINNFAKSKKLIKDNINIVGDDTREGWTAVRRLCGETSRGSKRSWRGSRSRRAGSVSLLGGLGLR